MTPLSRHLTEDEIDAILIGTSQNHEHLAACAECRERIAQISASIDDFSAITLAWSERRSSTLQPVVLAAAEWTRPLHWAVGAAVLLCGALFFSASHHRADNSAPPVAMTSTPVKSDMSRAMVASNRTSPASEVISPARRNDEFARDNRMLENIDDEWDATPPSPADAYELRTSADASAPPHLAPL